MINTKMRATRVHTCVFESIRVYDTSSSGSLNNYNMISGHHARYPSHSCVTKCRNNTTINHSCEQNKSESRWANTRITHENVHALMDPAMDTFRESIGYSFFLDSRGAQFRGAYVYFTRTRSCT